MSERTDLNCLAAIVRILSGLVTPADRVRAVELALADPVESDENVFHASGAIRRWVQRAPRPEFVATCVHAEVAVLEIGKPVSPAPSKSCPADTDTEITEERDGCACEPGR